MHDILTRAEPQGHIRLFLDRGEVIEEILSQIQSPGPLEGYINEIRRAFAKDVRWKQTTDTILAPVGERLSVREREILILIGQGASNRKIAGQLFISEGTVKTHVKHILRKLSAENRVDALARARELALID